MIDILREWIEECCDNLRWDFGSITEHIPSMGFQFDLELTAMVVVILTIGYIYYRINK